MEPWETGLSCLSGFSAWCVERLRLSVKLLAYLRRLRLPIIEEAEASQISKELNGKAMPFRTSGGFSAIQVCDLRSPSFLPVELKNGPA